MKNIIITTILGLLLISGIKAQAVNIPTFTESIVVMKCITIPSTTTPSFVVISDGASATYYLEISPDNHSLKKEQEQSNVPALAKIMNQLNDQGYKIAESYATINPNTLVTTHHYIFQKE